MVKIVLVLNQARRRENVWRVQVDVHTFVDSAIGTVEVSSIYRHFMSAISIG